MQVAVFKEIEFALCVLLQISINEMILGICGYAEENNNYLVDKGYQ